MQYKYYSFSEIKNELGESEKSKIAVLDGITDPRNFGAIIRSAAAFSIDYIIIPERNSVQVTDIVVKTSAYNENNVKIIRVKNIVRTIDELKKIGFWIYGADLKGNNIREENFAEKTAIILGSEGDGMRRLTKENIDIFINIPICKNVESLNVASAASIIFYEITK